MLKKYGNEIGGLTSRTGGHAVSNYSPGVVVVHYLLDNPHVQITHSLRHNVSSKRNEIRLAYLVIYDTNLNVGQGGVK